MGTYPVVGSPYGPFGAFRNRAVNGGFDVAQQGDSFVGLNPADYPLDQWRVGTAIQGGTISDSAVDRLEFALGQTDVPGEPRYYMRASGQITGGTVGSRRYNIGNIIESVGTFAGQKATASFWGRAPSPRDVGLDFLQSFGTGGSTLVWTRGAVFPLTTTWQYFKHTFDVPSISGKVLGANNDDYVEATLGLHVDASSPLSPVAPSAIPVEIAKFQIEAGPNASEFENLPYGQVLAQCQRYFLRLIANVGGATNRPIGLSFAQDSLTARGFINTPVEMRDTPALGGGAQTLRGNGSAFITIASYSDVFLVHGGNVQADIVASANLSIGELYTWLINSGSFLDIDARL